MSQRIVPAAGIPLNAGDENAEDDNARVLRYLAKCTIEPAINHRVADHVGSLQSGRLADILFWKPSWLGVKPEFVLTSGYPAWGALGEGNATVESAEATLYAAHRDGRVLAVDPVGDVPLSHRYFVR